VTTKDYKKIAKVIGEFDYSTPNPIKHMAEEFATMLREDNPRFDDDRFMWAVQNYSDEINNYGRGRAL
jgi:hypothetical protein